VRGLHFECEPCLVMARPVRRLPGPLSPFSGGRLERGRTTCLASD